MRNYTGLKTQTDHELSQNEKARHELVKLLHQAAKSDDTVVLGAEEIQKLHHRLHTEYRIMQKLIDEVRDLQTALHIANQK